jgi:hypothetical protein
MAEEPRSGINNRRLAIVDIHGYFKTKTKIGEARFIPFHCVLPPKTGFVFIISIVSVVSFQSFQSFQSTPGSIRRVNPPTIAPVDGSPRERGGNRKDRDASHPCPDSANPPKGGGFRLSEPRFKSSSQSIRILFSQSNPA